MQYCKMVIEKQKIINQVMRWSAEASGGNRIIAVIPPLSNHASECSYSGWVCHFWERSINYYSNIMDNIMVYRLNLIQKERSKYRRCRQLM